jgi:hypothetical protein
LGSEKEQRGHGKEKKRWWWCGGMKEGGAELRHSLDDKMKESSVQILYKYM